MIEVQKNIEDATDMVANYLARTGYNPLLRKEPGSINNKEIYAGNKLVVLLQEVGDGESRVIAAEQRLEGRLEEIFADDIFVLGTA